MRRDFLIGILVGIAALPAGVALMAAPMLFDHPPHWVLNLCFYGGLVLAVILIGLAVLIALRDEEAAKKRGQKRPVLAIVGMVVFGFGFLACAGWYFYPSKVGNHDSKSESLAPSPYDNTILIQCSNEAFPTKVPETGYVWAWWIPSNPDEDMGLNRAIAQPGMNVKSSFGPLSSALCTITNFHHSPMFSASIELRYSMVEMRRVGNAFQSFGKPQIDAKKTIDLQILEAGEEKTFTFWITNNSDKFVTIYLPTAISFIPTGSSNRVTAKLVESPRSMVSLSPIDARLPK